MPYTLTLIGLLSMWLPWQPSHLSSISRGVFFPCISLSVYQPFCMHLLHNTPFIVCVYIPVHVYVCVCDWLWSIVTVDTCMCANYYHLPCALNATAINFGSGLVWVTSHTIFGYAVSTCTVCICVHTMYMCIQCTCTYIPVLACNHLATKVFNYQLRDESRWLY